MRSFPCCALPYTAASKLTSYGTPNSAPATAHQIQLLEEEEDEEIDESRFTGGSTDSGVAMAKNKEPTSRGTGQQPPYFIIAYMIDICLCVGTITADIHDDDDDIYEIVDIT